MHKNPTKRFAARILIVAFALVVCAVSGVPAVAESSDEHTALTDTVASYMEARATVLQTGNEDALRDIAVIGIINDEMNHYGVLVASDIEEQESTYQVTEIDVQDTRTIVYLSETISYRKEKMPKTEVVGHVVVLIEDGGNLLVVSDSYAEMYSGFVSCSYVDPFVATLSLEGAASCIITVAQSQVGYMEKASNANLDSFTENAGSGNYTKYGEWFGKNPEEWCAMFVSWCANQACVDTSVIPKSARSTEIMNFFKDNGAFSSSQAYSGSYTPQPGDIFFTGASTTTAEHVGIVVSVGTTTVTVVEGNAGNQVKQQVYNLSNSSFLGFGTPVYGSSTHTYTWQYDSTYHWRVCSCCGYTTASLAHTLTDYVSYSVCSVCDATVPHTAARATTYP